MNKKRTNRVDATGAVIVCSHVASGQCPILYAEKSEPVDEVDLGWQLLCGSGAEERTEDSQVWSVEEALQLEPSLRAYLNEPYGTILVRDNRLSKWRKKQVKP